MTMTSDLGKGLIAIGILLVIAGLIVLYRDRLPGLNMLGKLPGDISIEKENFKFYAPLGTSLLISLILSFLLWLFRK
jgi:hypothetical protein